MDAISGMAAGIQASDETLSLATAFIQAGLPPTNASYCAALTQSLSAASSSLIPALEQTLRDATSGLPRSAQLATGAVEPCRTLQGLFSWVLNTAVRGGTVLGCFTASEWSTGVDLMATAGDAGLIAAARDFAQGLGRLSLDYCNGDIPGDWGQPYGAELKALRGLADMNPPTPPPALSSDAPPSPPPDSPGFPRSPGHPWTPDVPPPPDMPEPPEGPLPPLEPGQPENPHPSPEDNAHPPPFEEEVESPPPPPPPPPPPSGDDGDYGDAPPPVDNYNYYSLSTDWTITVGGRRRLAAAEQRRSRRPRAVHLGGRYDGPEAEKGGAAQQPQQQAERPIHSRRALLQGAILLGVQLANSSTDSTGRVLRGRPEVILPNGTRGTVCDDAFTDASATVLCRQLNASIGVAYNDSMFGSPSSPFVLDDLRCTGTETNVGQCPARALGSHDCREWEAAGILCYPARNSQAYCFAAAANISRFSPFAASRTAPTASRCAQLLAIAADVTTLLGNTFPGMPLSFGEALQLPCFNASVLPAARTWLAAWRAAASSAGCQAPNAPPFTAGAPPYCPTAIALWPTDTDRSLGNSLPTTYMDLSAFVQSNTSFQHYLAADKTQFRLPLTTSCTPPSGQTSHTAGFVAAVVAANTVVGTIGSVTNTTGGGTVNVTGAANATRPGSKQAIAWLRAVKTFSSLWSPRDLVNKTALALVLTRRNTSFALGGDNDSSPTAWLPSRMMDQRHLVTLLERFSRPGGIDLLHVLDDLPSSQVKRPNAPAQSFVAMLDSAAKGRGGGGAPPPPPDDTSNDDDDSADPSNNPSSTAPPRQPSSRLRPYPPATIFAQRIPLEPVCVSYEDSTNKEADARSLLAGAPSPQQWGVAVQEGESYLLSVCSKLTTRQAITGVSLANLAIMEDANNLFKNLLRPWSKATRQLPALPAANLAYLDVSGNDLWGPVPALPVPVLYANMSYNKLVGRLYDSLVQNLPYSTFATTLVLDLSFNSLTGPLPSLEDAVRYNESAWRALLDNAVRVDLSGNNLEGPLPPDWAPLLSTLDLVITSNPSLTGTVPSEWIEAALNPNSTRGGAFAIDLTGCSGLTQSYTNLTQYDVLRTEGTRLNVVWRNLTEAGRNWTWVVNRVAAGHMSFEQVTYKQAFSFTYIITPSKTIDSDDAVKVCSAVDKLQGQEQDPLRSAIIITRVGPWPRERTHLEVHDLYMEWQPDPAVWCYGGTHARLMNAVYLWAPTIGLAVLMLLVAFALRSWRKRKLKKKLAAAAW
ncbi:hypothetical protein HYH03_002001 [Edaphochlamys debaryana]|nr:hypothetical protein HYH03_002001 [Edaphochlamys debaryana]|eukprot:KAG2500432.1 hypothetical protein HYH03_002001 [Edaphochlamys debaryana]